MGCLANDIALIEVEIFHTSSGEKNHGTTITMVLMGTWLELWSVLLLILTLLTKEYIYLGLDTKLIW